MLNLDTNVIDPLAFINFTVKNSECSIDEMTPDMIDDKCIELKNVSADVIEKRKEFYLDMLRAIKKGYLVPFVSYTTIAEIALAPRNRKIFQDFIKEYCYTQKVTKTGDKLKLDCADEIEELATSFVKKYKFKNRDGEERNASAPMEGKFDGLNYVPKDDARIAATGAVYGISTLTNNVVDFIKLNLKDENDRRRQGLAFLTKKQGYVNGYAQGKEDVALPISVQELQDIVTKIKTNQPDLDSPYKALRLHNKVYLSNFQKADESIKIVGNKLEVPCQSFDDDAVEADLEDADETELDDMQVEDDSILDM